jgi:hypothetical protein
MIETILNLQELQNFSVYIEYRYCKQSTEDFSNLSKELGTIDKNFKIEGKEEDLIFRIKGLGYLERFIVILKEHIG